MRHLKSISIALLICTLLGCQTGAVKPQDVLQVACQPTQASMYTPERCAQAIGDVYAVYGRRAHELRADPATPPDVIRAIQRVDAEVTPIIVGVLDAAVALKTAAAGSITEDRRAELDAKVQAALPLVRTLPNL